MARPPAREGFLDFHDHRVWYRVVGVAASQRRLPLLVVHGGPGAAHDTLRPLQRLARHGRQVVFYDQLGCGRSDHPEDPEMWSLDLFLDELRHVRRGLGLDRAHLLGHSWGGMLAMEHAARGGEGLASLVLASSPVSMAQWVAEAARLRGELPADVQRVLLAHEASGTTADGEYVTAMLEYYRRHVCRLNPWPDFVRESFLRFFADQRVYGVMYGPSEFQVTGRLRDWDIGPRLREIRVAAMVTSGLFDEATPAIARTLEGGIRGAEWVLFQRSSHMAHLEETELYLSVVERFLESVESRPMAVQGPAGG